MSELKHIEGEGFVLNIRTGLSDREGRDVTHIEILVNENDWYFEGCGSNRLVRRASV